jgi:hypothetical protein
MGLPKGDVFGEGWGRDRPAVRLAFGKSLRNEAHLVGSVTAHTRRRALTNGWFFMLRDERFWHGLNLCALFWPSSPTTPAFV